MIEDLSKDKAASKTVDEGQMNVSFSPLLDFPGGRFEWKWRPNPVWAYDTTKTMPPVDYKPNLIDLFVESKIGGVFGTKGLAGYAQTGVDINIGFVQLSGGIGAASKDHNLSGLWTAGIKVSTR
jgi:hypothetical protein